MKKKRTEVSLSNDLHILQLTKHPAPALTTFLKANKISVGTSSSRTLSTKDLAKIGKPATIQLFCMNTKAEYAKLKKADKHSDVLLDLN